MARRLKYENLRGGARSEIVLSGSIVLTAAGAISSVTGFVPSAAAAVSPGVVKTAAKTGRYTVTLDRKYARVRALGAPGLMGPADAAFGNVNANLAQYRNIASNSFDIQLMLASTGADTDGASGTEIHWSVVAREA